MIGIMLHYIITHQVALRSTKTENLKKIFLVLVNLVEQLMEYRLHLILLLALISIKVLMQLMMETMHITQVLELLKDKDLQSMLMQLMEIKQRYFIQI